MCHFCGDLAPLLRLKCNVRREAMELIGGFFRELLLFSCNILKLKTLWLISTALNSSEAFWELLLLSWNIFWYLRVSLNWTHFRGLRTRQYQHKTATVQRLFETFGIDWANPCDYFQIGADPRRRVRKRGLEPVEDQVRFGAVAAA